MNNRIITAFLSEVDKYRSEVKRSGNWNFGVEHEFFLLNELSEPVTFEESQRFLKTISKNVDHDSYREPESDILYKISLNSMGHGYAQIKYDHEPHLLEITTGYHLTLNSLEAELTELFRIINFAAGENRFLISKSAYLGISPDDPRISRNTEEYRNLRQFRKLANSRIGADISEALQNYASVIAATQTHLGGQEMNWDKNSDIVHQLYMHESSIVGWSNLNASPRDRWKLYYEVYKNFPLVGFPKIEEWTLNSWSNALNSSPVLTSDFENSGRILKDIDLNFKNKPISDVFKAVRDLQIIRPKVFGTLEFRADPAQESISSILALVALRLGVAKSVVDGFRVKRSFSTERLKWWELVFQANVSPEREILEIAAHSLDRISADYRKYLEPYYAHIRSKSA